MIDINQNQDLRNSQQVNSKIIKDIQQETTKIYNQQLQQYKKKRSKNIMNLINSKPNKKPSTLQIMNCLKTTTITSIHEGKTALINSQYHKIADKILQAQMKKQQQQSEEYKLLNRYQKLLKNRQQNMKYMQNNKLQQKEEDKSKQIKQKDEIKQFLQRKTQAVVIDEKLKFSNSNIQQTNKLKPAFFVQGQKQLKKQQLKKDQKYQQKKDGKKEEKKSEIFNYSNNDKKGYNMFAANNLKTKQQQKQQQTKKNQQKSFTNIFSSSQIQKSNIFFNNLSNPINKPPKNEFFVSKNQGVKIVFEPSNRFGLSTSSSNSNPPLFMNKSQPSNTSNIFKSNISGQSPSFFNHPPPNKQLNPTTLYKNFGPTLFKKSQTSTLSDNDLVKTSLNQSNNLSPQTLK